ncbi:hypothetical protein [Mucilaginibacter lappiensis]|uniref:Concanavalin A-like lectin/glucanases superfamily protein n=1 Tax=Mucilaginibacter lappiensis TaxID=354630 RepID=A0A841JP98_9SPHI|nr:hypothetical protein [Mucilaginibacter lappiensis]MBB6130145.1 hypothetical protein [Mucilaginibacter lappiensis]
MKKLFLSTILSFVFSSVLHAQWTTSGNNAYYSYAGNVGIGNSAPDAKLTVFSSIPLGNTPKNAVLISSISSIAGTTNNFKNNIWLVRNSAGSDWLSARLHDGITIDASFTNPQTDTRTWWERDPNQDIQSWGTSANTYLTLKQGNVGINTTSPSAKLSLGQAVSNKGLFIYDSGTEASGFGQAAFEFRVFGAASSTNHVSFGKYDLTSDGFFEQMRLDNAGNLSIGATDSKGYKLAVNGSAIATSMTVKLNSAWPDYVFKKDYQLPSLQEVKAYIDQNQHLPEIPSEQQIAKDGLNLGEMNKLLMKKVEELTLYLIEMKEEIKDLQKQNKDLEKQIK